MKMGAHRSPKVAQLERALGCGRSRTVGTLELFWLFTMEQAPAGDVGKWSDDDIEAACDWDGDPGALIAALVESRWVDECERFRLVVHDWPEHAPEFLKKRAKRNHLEFAVPVWTAADAGHQRRPTAT